MVPPNLQDIKVEAVFDADSTLLIAIILCEGVLRARSVILFPPFPIPK